MNLGIGISHVVIKPIVFSNNRIGVKLYNYEYPKLFNALEYQKQDIENELGYPLEWNAPRENSKASSLVVYGQGDYLNDEQYSEIFQWFFDKIGDFYKFFPTKINKINVKYFKQHISN